MTTFEIVSRPMQPTAVVHATVRTDELPRFFARAYGEVFSAMQAQGVMPVGPPFALYFGMPGETVELEAGFPVSGAISESATVHAGALPAAKCAHGVHVGPYDALSTTYAELQRWMGERHLSPHPEMWEVYLSDPRQEPDPATWRTEIFWPVD